MKEINQTIYFYQAECGDAARIKFKDDNGKYHNILIDSGYKKTYRNIIDAHVKDIQHTKEELDLWIVTHIHDDHIGGIEQYINQITSGESIDIVKAWYYNSPRKNNGDFHHHLDEISSAKSIKQGDLLTKYLKNINKLPEQDIITNNEAIDIYGLKLFIIGPSFQKLKSLRDKYESDPNLPIEKHESDLISEAKAVIKDDYHIKLIEFDLSKWEEDSSIENGSSISVLTEFKGSKILWLADSHPSDIIQSLRMLGYSETNKIKCDWVKVTHHGSKANNNDELYSLIECCNYLFSADGKNRHKLPTKESIARILRNKYRNHEDEYHLYFTYDNEVLRGIFINESKNIYEDLNFQVHYNSKSNLKIDI